MAEPGEFLIATALKATQWERAKGELHALVAVQGAYQAHSPAGKPTSQWYKWMKLQQLVDHFVKEVEEKQLQL